MADFSNIRQLVRQVLSEDAEFQTEYGGQYAEESEMLYRDKNVVIIVPKSQMASKVYGRGTQWCSVTLGGFNAWSKEGLLIRFLFKGGRKIRLTYIFDQEKDRHGEDYNWANENGRHILMGTGNPFQSKNPNTQISEFIFPKEQTVVDMKNDVLGLISQIPQEGKNKVLDFIEKHRQTYEYCYKEDEYRGKHSLRKEAEAEYIQDKYEPLKKKMQDKHNRAVVSIRYSKSKNKFEVSYTPNWTGEDYPTETFVDIKPAEKLYVEKIREYLNTPTTNPAVKSTRKNHRVFEPTN